jgi:hypothetical protein
MGEFLSSLIPDAKGALIMQAAKVVPAIISFGQARKAKEQQGKYLDDIRTLEKNRQNVINPYASLTNPYANMSVATKAADMQAEQADIALANTLDTLRATGASAGGATALAQAALKSKQGITASIEKQEVQNERLKAQGQLQVDMAKARGAGLAFQAQERRDEIQLDRLQGQADIEAARRAQGFAGGVGALTSAAGGAANALIRPKLASENPTIPEIQSGLSVDQGVTSGENIFGTPVAGLNYNQSQLNNIMQDQQDLNNLINAGVTQDQLENITIDTGLQNNNTMDDLNYGNQVIIK